MEIEQVPKKAGMKYFRSVWMGAFLLMSFFGQESPVFAADSASVKKTGFSQGKTGISSPMVRNMGIEEPGNIESEILELVNQYRKKKKLPPLQWNEAMAKAAEQHSTDMAKRRTSFGHAGFDARVKKIAATEGMLKGWAENVAFGNLSARQVVDGWIKSPGHRKNIEGKYNLIGVGVARSRSGELYFTQIFGLK